MDPELIEDDRMLFVVGLRPHDWHLEPEQERCGEDRDFDIRTHRDYDPVERVDAEFFEHLELGGVCADGLGEMPAQTLNDRVIQVDPEHFGAGIHELERERGTETPEPDDGDGIGFGDPVQRPGMGGTSGHDNSLLSVGLSDDGALDGQRVEFAALPDCERGSEHDRADAAHEHECRQHELAERAELRGDPDR